MEDLSNIKDSSNMEDLSNTEDSSNMEDASDIIEEDEDAQTKALRLCLPEILQIACEIYPATRFKDFVEIIDTPTINSCRLVSKEWNLHISDLFHKVDQPFLVVNPANFYGQFSLGMVEKEYLDHSHYLSIINTSPLIRSVSTFAMPPLKLSLQQPFFYAEVENLFIQTILPDIQEYIFHLEFSFPADSTMRFLWPHLKLENLRHIEIDLTNTTRGCNPRFQPEQSIEGLNPFKYGNYIYLLQNILSGAINAKTFKLRSCSTNWISGLFKLIFPEELEELELPLCKMGQNDFEDCILYGREFRKLKKLTIGKPFHHSRRKHGLDERFAGYLVGKCRKTIEELNLGMSGPYYGISLNESSPLEILKLDITEPLPHLQTLSIGLGSWGVSVSGTECFQSYLPSLKTLELTSLDSELQIKDLYDHNQVPSATVESLKIKFRHSYMAPLEMLEGFASNFPNLKILSLGLSDKAPGLHVVFQHFVNLKTLSIGYYSHTYEGRKMLKSAMTGISVEELDEIVTGGWSNSEILERFGHRSSVKNMTELEEMYLHMNLMSMEPLNIQNQTDISIVCLVGFLRMPKLKEVSIGAGSTLTISEEMRRKLESHDDNPHKVRLILH